MCKSNLTMKLNLPHYQFNIKKNDNWESLLTDGKLGVLAALRNIRNMMKNPRKSVIDAWCKLITTDGLIRKSLVLPIQIDLAYETVMREFADTDYSPQVQQALLDAYEMSIPNLASVLTGKTSAIVQCIVGHDFQAVQ